MEAKAALFASVGLLTSYYLQRQEKRLFKRLLCLSFVILFGFATSICLGKYSGGDGSEATPYRISNAYDMNDIGLHDEDWGKHFVMVNDVNLAQFTGTQFNIIGNDSNAFTGVFDGNDFAISNFTYTCTNTNNIGIFGRVGTYDDSNAVIKDLTLIDPNVNAGTGDRVGSLVGLLNYGTINNCYAEGGSVSGNFTVGGLAGYNKGTISNCYATGSVSGFNFTGGLAGFSPSGTISDCYATGNVNGNYYTGGLVGSGEDIYNCYAAGDVNGNYYTGGLVGMNKGTISNCYAAGDVNGNAYTGGLVGYGTDISNCYATGDVNGNDCTGGLVGYFKAGEGGMRHCYTAGTIDGNDYTGGLVGYHYNGGYVKSFWDSDVNPDVNGIGDTTDPNVIGKSTAEMQKESTFTNWDFIEIWNIGENQTYPFLRVYPAGDLNHDGRVDGRDLAIIAMRWLDGI